MNYQHSDVSGALIDLPVGKVVCVGRNYADHAKELGNEVPKSPILFLKPATSLVALGETLDYPKQHGSCHFETEIAVLLKEDLTDASAAEVEQAIWGFALALDLTLRDVQNALKAKGHPWERAKAFDGSCPITSFVPKADLPNALKRAQYALLVDDEPRQTGDTDKMLFAILPLIAQMSSVFTLKAGDIILTGTPAGVGPLESGKKLDLLLEQFAWSTQTR
ncbi:MAG: fumarylacetoacetate hydrolase family protein [Pseudomonadota bacterium]|nr:fumarylacetoacetate hydrolase family protein [Pseudomonadota bacterium]